MTRVKFVISRDNIPRRAPIQMSIILALVAREVPQWIIGFLIAWGVVLWFLWIRYMLTVHEKEIDIFKKPES